MFVGKKSKLGIAPRWKLGASSIHFHPLSRRCVPLCSSWTGEPSLSQDPTLLLASTCANAHMSWWVSGAYILTFSPLTFTAFRLNHIKSTFKIYIYLYIMFVDVCWDSHSFWSVLCPTTEIPIARGRSEPGAHGFGMSSLEEQCLLSSSHGRCSAGFIMVFCWFSAGFLLVFCWFSAGLSISTYI